MAGSTGTLVRPEAASDVRPPTSSRPPCFRTQKVARRALGAGLRRAGNIDVMRAEADTEGAHAGAGVLIQRPDFLGDLGAIDDAEILGQAKGDAARRRCEILRRAQIEEGLEQFPGTGGEPEVDPRLDLLARCRRQRVVGEQDKAGLQRVFGFDEAGDRRALPAQGAVDGRARSRHWPRRRPVPPAWRSRRRGIWRPSRARPSRPARPRPRPAANRKPESVPTCWPSTNTSPTGVISASSIAFSFSRLISTLVRRSTKRAVRRSCSASDRRSSIARVRSCQWPGSASQCGRLAAKVQVRIWAMRLARVSMSPSVRSA